jgi:hypothetical protein
VAGEILNGKLIKNIEIMELHLENKVALVTGGLGA